MSALIVRVPIRVSSGLNLREHWRKRAARVKKERSATRLALLSGGAPRLVIPASPGEKRIVVRFTRIAPRKLDEGDGLESAFKSVRDELCAYFGVSDGPASPIFWLLPSRQRSERPREYAVQIEIEPMEAVIGEHRLERLRARAEASDPEDLRSWERSNDG